MTDKKSVPSAEQIEEIKARAGKATAGPWARSHFVDQQRYVHMSDVWKMEREYEEQRVVRAGGPRGRKVCLLPDDNLAQFDGEFIAHAREDIPALLSVLDAALARMSRLEAERDTYRSTSEHWEREYRKIWEKVARMFRAEPAAGAVPAETKPDGPMPCHRGCHERSAHWHEMRGGIECLNPGWAPVTQSAEKSEQ